MPGRALQFRFGIPLVLALVCGNAAPASGPLFPGQQYEVGNGPISVAAVDLDGDGQVDLAVANHHSYDVSVLLNNGDGTFGTAVNYGVDDWAEDLAVGDLNGDECPDLVVARPWASVAVLLNNGDGTFGPPICYAAGYAQTSVAVALLSAYGACQGDPHYDPNADFDHNGCIALSDLATLLAHYGTRT